MKPQRVILLAALALLCLCAACLPRTARGEPTLLTIYEGPKTMASSQTATVTANGYDLFVYDVMVNHEHIWNANTQPGDTPMTYFDFTGRVRLEIRMPGLGKPVESAEVLPLSLGIVPEVEDGLVRFEITEPGPYTVVFNGKLTYTDDFDEYEAIRPQTIKSVTYDCLADATNLD